jgi:protocatechuate 3,4-dioxygenase beta subunit
MDFWNPMPTRRGLMRGGLALGAAALLPAQLFAEELLKTPRLTEGPFYPDKLPLDTDNDLIIINKSLTPAIGEITHLTGRILDTSGNPIKDATVEIWQCDANAVYIHTRDSGPKEKQRDKNFQGFGRFTTDSKGGYRFRTIKPVPYPGRPAPHIHFKIKKSDRELLTSQFFINGHPGNTRDGVFAGLHDPIDRELVMVDFKPIKESKISELSAQMDIVIGRTPDEDLERRRKR